MNKESLYFQQLVLIYDPFQQDNEQSWYNIYNHNQQSEYFDGIHIKIK